MTTYSFAQLEGLWVNAGGPKTLAPLMAAIALAESGGRSDAVNPTDNNGTQTSWGIWQISNGTHNWPGVMNPLDPLNNAAYAVQKFHDQGLGAWGTYTSGAYRSHYPGNIPPPSQNIPQSGGSGTTPPPNIGAGTSSSGTGGVFIAEPSSTIPADPAKFSLFGYKIGGIPGSLLQGLEFSMPGAALLADPTQMFKVASSVPKALGAIGELFAKAISMLGSVVTILVWLAMPQHWLRIGFGLVGVIFLGVAGYMIATAS